MNKQTKIKWIKIADIKPYENNAKEHDDTQIMNIATSLEKYGWQNPVLLDKDNVIIAGHGRILGAKELGMTEAPCIYAENLTEQQIKEYRYLDNKLNESEWIDDILELELPEMDLTEFDFGEWEAELEHQQNKEETQFAKENILNLAHAQFEGTGKYDIPQIKPIYEMPEIDEWIGFNYVLSDKSTAEEKARKGVHFFIDDYQFERVWNEPNKYIDKLREYGAVLSPDFSPYGDMPLATQIYNHYRKHWCGAYWQSQGITVIPTIRSSTDERSFEFYLEGEPKESIVAYSSMWLREDRQELYLQGQKEYEMMKEELNPKHILIYGKIQPFMKDDEITRIATFTEKRWNDNEE